MLVGDELSYSDVLALLLPAETQLGRKINPTLYTMAEVNTKFTQGQSFLCRVFAQEKYWLVGEESFTAWYKDVA